MTAIRSALRITTVLLLLLVITPLNARSESYLRRRAAANPTRFKRKKQRGNQNNGDVRKNNNDTSISALDQVRNNHRNKRGNGFDSIRGKPPDLDSSGSRRPRDIPGSPPTNTTKDTAAPDEASGIDDVPSEEVSNIPINIPINPILPSRPHDIPKPLDDTPSLEDLVQDLFANEQAEVQQDVQEEVMPEPATAAADDMLANDSMTPQTLNDRPLFIPNATATTGNSTQPMEPIEPIVFEDVVAGNTDFQFIGAPAYKPNVCGANVTEAKEICASKPSCGRAELGEDCYVECNLFNLLECGEGKWCIPLVSECMGFATLPDGLEDNLFTRINIDHEESRNRDASVP